MLTFSEIMHGEVKYFLEIHFMDEIFPFAVISLLHWNDSTFPQLYKPLQKIITTKTDSEYEYVVLASNLNGIISLFPLKEKIQEKDPYVVVSYKFDI